MLHCILIVIINTYETTVVDGKVIYDSQLQQSGP